MQLIFERGNREAPAGHALIYFRADDDSILATYVSVPPIPFNLGDFVPSIFAGMLQGMDLDTSKVSTPMPPIPQPVRDLDWLQGVAARRGDDLVFAGGVMRGDPMRMAAQAGEAAQEYGELYSRGFEEPATEVAAPRAQEARFAAMSEAELLNELTGAIGRLRDSLRFGRPDDDAQAEVRNIALLLPAKYRGAELADVASRPGDAGQRLAELYLERAFKLYREDYLDLARLDREIDALGE